MAEHLSGYTGLGYRAKSQSRLADEFSGLLSAIGATDAVRPLADATASVFRDSRQLEAVIEQYANTNPSQLQGRALEFLEVLKSTVPQLRRVPLCKLRRPILVIPLQPRMC